MSLEAFFDAHDERVAAYSEQSRQNQEGEQEQLDDSKKPFSIVAIVAEYGGDYIQRAIHLTWEEFKELYRIVKHPMSQTGRGRRRSLERIDRFFILMLYLTSGAKFKHLERELKLSLALVARTIHQTLNEIEGQLEQFFAQTRADIQCDISFENYPDALGVVDASPIFIQRPVRHQSQYYSGKFKWPCVKVQAFVTGDGQRVHLSKVYRGATHDKAMFDHSGLSQFLAPAEGESHPIILADLGYIGITRVCPNAVLPHRKPPFRPLAEAKQKENRVLSRDRILIENFFGRWKTLFGICHEEYRGDLKLLSKIIRVTIAMTNWYIRLHPLRRPDEELLDESDGERGGEAKELDAASGSDDDDD
jgi:hypothetical protein